MANIGFDTFLPLGSLFSLFRSNVRGAYRFGYQVLHGATQFNNFATDSEKLATVLSSPAVLKVISLQCDLFSMGKICVLNENDEEIEDDPFLDLLKRPNPFQQRSQFLWDFMFWNMLGTDYCYVNSKVIDERNKMYFLNPAKIEWPREMDRIRDKLVFSDSEIKSREKMTIRYRYDDGTYIDFPLSRLIISTDLTNGIGNWYKGPSRLDALYKIVSNSEYALDAKNINMRYAGKFLVGSQNDTSKIGLGEEEKKDIEQKVDSDDKRVWALKSMIQIRRFVDDFKSLELGKSFLEDYFLIGSMYGIPRDVLEAYNSATYENQEKARAAHVNYCFDPKGNQFMDAFEVFFGYDQQGKNIQMSWDHLPFMQVFEKERVEVMKARVETFKALIDMGVPVDQANMYAGTEFEIDEEKRQQNQNNNGQQEQEETDDQLGDDQGNPGDEGENNQE